MRLGVVIWTAVLAVGIATTVLAKPAGPVPTDTSPNWSKYRSPFDLAFSPDGKVLAVSDKTAAKLVLIDTATGKVTKEVALTGEPTGLTWCNMGKAVLVCEYAAGTIAEVDVATGKITRRMQVAPLPMGVACACKNKIIVVTNHGTNTVSLVDAETGKEKIRLAGFMQPCFATVTPDMSIAAVGNLIPAMPASDQSTSASITLIDVVKGAKVADIRLPAGGAVVRGLAVSADGKWLYAVHTVGRTNLPTTQLERGWVNTNAMSVIDLEKKEVYATLLLDRPSEGAADPWGLAISKDGKTIFVGISGVHQIARIDLENLHKLLAGQDPNPPAAKDLY